MCTPCQMGILDKLTCWHGMKGLEIQVGSKSGHLAARLAEHLQAMTAGCAAVQAADWNLCCFFLHGASSMIPPLHGAFLFVRIHLADSALYELCAAWI